MAYYAKSDSPISAVDSPEGVPPPLVIWGPGDPRPTVPIAGWDPATGTWPPQTEPLPPGIWGPNDPRPTVPIAEPPWGWGNPPPLPELPPTLPFKPAAVWSPETGWVTVLVPTGNVPTPSKRR